MNSYKADWRACFNARSAEQKAHNEAQVGRQRTTIYKDEYDALVEALRQIKAKDTSVNGEYGYFACIALSALATARSE